MDHIAWYASTLYYVISKRTSTTEKIPLIIKQRCDACVYEECIKFCYFLIASSFKILPCPIVLCDFIIEYVFNSTLKTILGLLVFFNFFPENSSIFKSYRLEIISSEMSVCASSNATGSECWKEWGYTEQTWKKVRKIGKLKRIYGNSNAKNDFLEKCIVSSSPKSTGEFVAGLAPVNAIFHTVRI